MTYTSDLRLPSSAIAFLNGVGVRGSILTPFAGVFAGPLPSSSAGFELVPLSFNGIGVLSRLVSLVCNLKVELNRNSFSEESQQTNKINKSQHNKQNRNVL